MNAHVLHRALPVAALLAGLAGCGGAPVAPPPKPATVSIEAGDTVNPAADGSSSRVNLRVYVLSDPDALMQADFDAFWSSDQAVLADAMLARYPETVVAGQRKEIEIEIGPDARAIGVAGEFRSPDGSAWRAAVPVTTERRRDPLRFRVQVGARSVGIAAAQAE